jgi:nitrite reductase/ring-hydroxylating ferredoxin subunit/alkylhydroperoxidase/carboxymuconolactone decarboxylase family protein YurZ
MSDAIDFLLKARPDAMPHYFAFLKQCGTRLDPKTRDLISVITKVHAQTERGFRQYVKRALKDGCSVEEVLDALLMAFPALGFSKIVWAVDQLLEMDLPQVRAIVAATAEPRDTSRDTVSEARPFDRTQDRPSALGALAPGGAAVPAKAWHDVTAVDSVAFGETRCVSVQGRGLVVFRGTAGYVVYDNRCPHQGTLIDQGHVSGSELTCPKHAWRFDLATGACIDKGDKPLMKLESRVAYDRLLARW